MILIDLLMFVLACIVLARSGAWIVQGLIKIAKFLNLGEFTIGFVVMAFATSLPELFVSISGSIAGAGGLVIGNIIGSNIANLGLVLGIGILLLKGVKIESDAIRTDSLHMFLIVLLPLLLMLDRQLSRIDGAILICMFIIYLIKLFKSRKRFAEKKYDIHWREMFSSFALTFIGLILLLVSAHFVVQYAIKISIDIGITEILIGLILVAIGTSLPELVFEISSALKGHHKMGLGTIIGSVVINSTLVLGVAALIRPITADFVLFLSSAVFLIAISFLFVTFVESESKLSLKEGLSLLLFYVLFIIVQLSIKGTLYSG